jgi:hypothetical protein
MEPQFDLALYWIPSLTVRIGETRSPKSYRF